MTKIPNALTEKEIEVACLISKGRSESEIAQQISMSRQWVTKLKTRPEFQQCVAEFTESFKKTKIETQKEQWMKDMRGSQYRMNTAREKIFTASDLLCDQLLKRLENLDIEELKASAIPGAIKLCADSFTAALALDNQLLALDRIIKELLQIRLIAGNPLEMVTSNLNKGDELSE